MNKNFNGLRTISSQRTWSTPQVIDLDDRRAVEAGAVVGSEAGSPMFNSIS
tara:strand:- start:9 stop:161 length:153 start_codon:yes stop_codon:yes gene_type:complete